MVKTAPLQDEETIGLAGWAGQTHGMRAAHRHLDLEVNYVLAGTITYLVGGRIVTLPPHRLCLLWGGVPHQMIRSREAADAIWITIPLTTVLRWGLPDTLIRPLLATGFLEDAAPRPSDLDLLHQWLGDLPGRGSATERRRITQKDPTLSPVGEIVLREIEARLRRFALGLAPLTAPATEPAVTAATATEQFLPAVEAMARFVAGNFQRDIGIAQIAAQAHLHPNYAMTLFRRHTGMTLSRYLTLQRVAHAQRLLATTEDPIQEIALGSGWGSVSRFYEAFREQTGLSPRRFRRHLEPRV